MYYFGGLIGFVVFALWMFCVVDVIITDDGACRNLPKLGWIVLVLFFPLVGSIAWLVAGKPAKSLRTLSAHERSTAAYPEYDRPGRFAATSAADDEEFLRRCRERAEEQRRKYRESN